jgi:hypothetical protein
MIGYTVVGLSVVGFVVGLTLRLRTFLLFVGLVLIAAIVYSIGAGSGFFSTFLNIVAAEAILQDWWCVIFFQEIDCATRSDAVRHQRFWHSE